MVKTSGVSTIDKRRIAVLSIALSGLVHAGPGCNESQLATVPIGWLSSERNAAQPAKSGDA
jgi:hypothetical protein